MSLAAPQMAVGKRLQQLLERRCSEMQNTSPVPALLSKAIPCTLDLALKLLALSKSKDVDASLTVPVCFSP